MLWESYPNEEASWVSEEESDVTSAAIRCEPMSLSYFNTHSFTEMSLIFKRNIVDPLYHHLIE